MGMFDKDKEIGRVLQTVFNFGDEFILRMAEVMPEKVKTDLGDATKTVLTVSRLDSPGEEFEVSTLSSPIAEKAKQLEEGELPAVVQLLEVPSNFGGKAVVIQYVRDYDK